MNKKYLIPQVNTAGLVLHYKMWDGFVDVGEVGSSSIFDYSLNSNAGTVAGTIVIECPGMDFGPTCQIASGSGATLDDFFSGGATVAIWLAPDSQGPTNDAKIIDKSRNGNEGWRIYCPASDTTLRFHLATDTTDGNWTFPIAMASGLWQHMAVVYDSDNAATGGGPTVYINGLAVVVTEEAAPDDAVTSDAANQLDFGTQAAGGDYYDGSMDDAMFFNRELSATEVKSIFSETRRRYGV